MKLNLPFNPIVARVGSIFAPSKSTVVLPELFVILIAG